jgi:uncharacterized protein (DUF2147 family)
MPKETLKQREKMMKITMFLAGMGALAIIGLGAGVAHAGDPTGIWLRDSGSSKVKIAKCGAAFCGTIVWLKDKDGPAKIGQRVFYNMKADGDNSWEGNAFNPEDGKTYSGTMSLSGSTLTTAGCVMGGLICRSTNWSKSN